MSAISVEFVVAAGRNGVIGRNGDLPWRLRSDLKRFRALTLDKPVIMGRKTYDSIGKPLDRRTNIVITRDRAFAADGVEIAYTPEEGVALADAAARHTGANAIMVIGGAEIYRQLLDHADVIHLTRVDLAPEGDAVFVVPDGAGWRKTAEDHVEPGPEDDAAFTVETYRRTD